MSYQTERDQFMRQTAPYLSEDTARKLLRYASTLQRLAVAQCNGDWPAENGNGTPWYCPQCEAGWRSRPQTGCPDCRAQRLVTRALQGTNMMPVFGGDPRGAVLRLFLAGTSHEDIDSGRERGIYVPARER